METLKDTFDFDLSRMEQLLREKLTELQLKTDSLEQTQNELSQSRRSLYEMERAIDEERRNFGLMKSQFDVAVAATKRWEEEKARDRCEQVQLKLKCESIAKERDSLLQLSTSLRLENMMMTQKLQEMKVIATNRESVDETVVKLKTKMSLVISMVDSEMPKLRKDVDTLEKSVESVNQLNKRLQAAGMCAIGIQRRYETKILELENKLNSKNQIFG